MLACTFVLTIVYAFNTKEERRSLWCYLETMSRGVNSPCIAMGDFNSVLNFEDRIGGNSITMDEIEDFHQCVENCELIELTTSGNKYT